MQKDKTICKVLYDNKTVCVSQFAQKHFMAIENLAQILHLYVILFMLCMNPILYPYKSGSLRLHPTYPVESFEHMCLTTTN